jgi:hypothetical protein
MTNSNLDAKLRNGLVFTKSAERSGISPLAAAALAGRSAHAQVRRNDPAISALRQEQTRGWSDRALDRSLRNRCMPVFSQREFQLNPEVC